VTLDEDGSAEVTCDGSPVAVYRALPAEPGFTPLMEALRPAADVLDLGSGAGRLANLLAARGFSVTAVDASAAMLAGIAPPVEVVQARIEDLRLERRFDVVVLASQLVNDPDPALRRALLATARAHVAGSGSVFLEHLEAELLAGPRERTARVGPVDVCFRVVAVRGQEIDGEVRYLLDDGRAWTQRFTSVLLDDATLARELASVGLAPRRRLSPSWLEAEPTPRPARRPCPNPAR
jgi:SAM-dependent methyltransferase